MASYSSYKKVHGDQLIGNALDASHFSGSPNESYGVKWFYGTMCRCSPGCCCNWTVPTGVQNMWIQAWGAGGNGTGACSCNRCHHYEAAQGGYYNSKMLETNGGCQYTVCAAGVYPCLSRECYGCMGCTSYVNGYNLTTINSLGHNIGIALNFDKMPSLNYSQRILNRTDNIESVNNTTITHTINGSSKFKINDRYAKTAQIAFSSNVVIMDYNDLSFIIMHYNELA